MAGRSAAEREALDRQNSAIMAVFERAGFQQIAPDIIQPADIFLERSGEDIRARTFVFNDPDGNELCLRPDLTVPACRYHLTHAPNAEARYSYLGPAFRFPDETLSPQEFTQAGIEWFGGGDPVTEDARVLKLAISALEAAGLTKLKITIGDLGLFRALLADISMPERWRRRLLHQFWRPQAFHELLSTMSVERQVKRSTVSALVDAVAGKNAEQYVAGVLAERGIPLAGDRSVADVAARLSEKLADRSEKPIAEKMVQAIDAYLASEGAASEVVGVLHKIFSGPGYKLAVDCFDQRLNALEEMGLNTRRVHFDANFGRELEYYTGFVFQIEANVGNHPVAVVGGGRYDDLLKDLGAETRIPAIGCAIHTERLKMVLG